MESAFGISQRKVDDVLIIEVTGHLNSTTSHNFQSLVLQEIEGGASRILIDCANLVYISSAGLRALMLAVRELKPIGGMLGLTSLQEHLVKSLKVSGILGMFEVYEDTDGALSRLS